MLRTLCSYWVVFKSIKNNDKTSENHKRNILRTLHGNKWYCLEGEGYIAIADDYYNSSAWLHTDEAAFFTVEFVQASIGCLLLGFVGTSI